MEKMLLAYITSEIGYNDEEGELKIIDFEVTCANCKVDFRYYDYAYAIKINIWEMLAYLNK